jgi:hypothetical protein
MSDMTTKNEVKLAAFTLVDREYRKYQQIYMMRAKIYEKLKIRLLDEASTWPRHAD